MVFLAASVVAGRANIYSFTIDLNGLNETPPNTSPATGFGTASFDSVANTVDLSVTFSGLLSAATASHIHDSATGVAGPVM